MGNHEDDAFPEVGVVEMAGVSIRTASPASMLDWVFARVAHGTAAPVHFVNAYTFSLIDASRDYAQLFDKPAVNFPDGKPLSLALRHVVGAGSVQQVRGPSFFASCLERGRERELRHFFLGGSEELLEQLEQRVIERFPGIRVVGHHSPPFRELSSDERRAQDSLIISGERPDIIWVGLGTPKQDYEANRLSASLGITAIAVGAAFDFMAGTKREAPPWMSRFGVEWVFRLLSEPKRLWRRYLFGNTIFLRMVWREWREGQGAGSRRP